MCGFELHIHIDWIRAATVIVGLFAAGVWLSAFLVWYMERNRYYLALLRRGRRK